MIRAGSSEQKASDARRHPRIVFRTLGEVAICRSGKDEPETVLVQSKPLAVLSYVCCEHCFAQAGRRRRKQRTSVARYGSHRRDTLVGLFWPEHDDAHAHGALRQTLHGLRLALGDDVLITRGKTDVAVDTQALWCDACAFLESLDGGDVEHAVSLYGGAFLSGVHATGMPEFTRWMETARDRLQRAYAAGLEQMADQAARQGDALRAAEWWRQAFEHDPYNSRIVIRAMEALDASGARGDALRVAERHHVLLQHTFDAALDPEVQATTERLKEIHSPPHLLDT